MAVAPNFLTSISSQKRTTSQQPLCQIYSKLKLKTLTSLTLVLVFYCYFEQILQIVLMSPLLTPNKWIPTRLKLNNSHCVKSVLNRSYSGPHFSRISGHLNWMRRDTPYLSIFSPNAGKCRKNADQNNSEFFILKLYKIFKTYKSVLKF